ncbi:hypothetical protein [Novosphingobium sp.]|uniref:hypothetical protein n=1 Tax=Novosphingobium sp. TaxID=1874826 RepID=UPI002FDDEA36
MSAVATAEPVIETTQAEVLPPATDIIQAVFDNPEIALLNPERRAAFVAKVREASRIAEPDAGTAKGRDEIRKAASKVTRTKTMLDQARKDLTAEYRKKTADINEAGKVVVDQLDALADEVRLPLTEWETAEKAREQRCTEILTWLQNASVVGIAETSADIRKRGNQAFGLEITKAEFGKRYDEALALKDVAVMALRVALETAIQREDEQAELQRLREEAAARAEQDRIEQEAREAEAAEAKRKADQEASEALEAQRIEKAKADAADAERKKIEAAKQAEIDAANARADEAEAQAKRVQQQSEYARNVIQHCRDCARGFIGGQPYPFALLQHELEHKVRVSEEDFGEFAAEVEQARKDALADLIETKRRGDEKRALEQEKAEREQQAAAERAEQERRERSRKHRQSVMTAIKTKLIEVASIDEGQATAIVKALVGGQVPHSMVEF